IIIVIVTRFLIIADLVIIHVGAGVAYIADPVPIHICLVGIGGIDTVIHVIADAVQIRILAIIIVAGVIIIAGVVIVVITGVIVVITGVIVVITGVVIVITGVIVVVTSVVI